MVLVYFESMLLTLFLLKLSVLITILTYKLRLLKRNTNTLILCSTYRTLLLLLLIMERFHYYSNRENDSGNV